MTWQLGSNHDIVDAGDSMPSEGYASAPFEREHRPAAGNQLVIIIALWVGFLLGALVVGLGYGWRA